MPRAGWARSQPNRLRDRQSERQERRKRGACIDPSGYDAGKKIKGIKRHILVDTVGLLLHAKVHPANIQDRDGGVLLQKSSYDADPRSTLRARVRRIYLPAPVDAQAGAEE